MLGQMICDWIAVPGQRFSMGGGPRDNENPRHEVWVSSFHLARAPVTREQYQEFLDATGHPAPPFWHDPAFAGTRLPAVGPSWLDAMAFCARAAEPTGEPAPPPTQPRR